MDHVMTAKNLLKLSREQETVKGKIISPYAVMLLMLSPDNPRFDAIMEAVLTSLITQTHLTQVEAVELMIHVTDVLEDAIDSLTEEISREDMYNIVMRKLKEDGSLT